MRPAWPHSSCLRGAGPEQEVQVVDKQVPGRATVGLLSAPSPTSQPRKCVKSLVTWLQQAGLVWCLLPCPAHPGPFDYLSANWTLQRHMCQTHLCCVKGPLPLNSTKRFLTRRTVFRAPSKAECHRSSFPCLVSPYKAGRWELRVQGPNRLAQGHTGNKCKRQDSNAGLWAGVAPPQSCPTPAPTQGNGWHRRCPWC